MLVQAKHLKNMAKVICGYDFVNFLIIKRRGCWLYLFGMSLKKASWHAILLYESHAWPQVIANDGSKIRHFFELTAEVPY